MKALTATLAVALSSLSVSVCASQFSCDGQTLTSIMKVREQVKSHATPNQSPTYWVEGIVTKTTSSLYKGFFFQDSVGDNNPNTSDGIFAYTSSNDIDGLAVGDKVCVEAKAKQFYGMTQLTVKPGHIENKGLAPQPIRATDIVVGSTESLSQAMDRYQGMLVRIAPESDLRITRNFGFDFSSRRNNMVLSHQSPLIKPTQLFVAETEQVAKQVEANTNNQLYIDTDQYPANGVIPYFPGFDAQQGYLRIGDRVENLQGVIAYSYGKHRLLPTNTVSPSDFVHINDRTSAPKVITDSNLKVASFNVLNFFTSHSDIGGSLNPTCKDQADADAAKGCNRGAKTAAEFELQRTKIVNALTAMDADIIGIMEMENNGFGKNSAIQNLVDELNLHFNDSSDHYQFVEINDKDKNKGQFFGSDAIMVAMLYRPSKVTPIKDAQVIRMPSQHMSATNAKGESVKIDAYQRDTLLQQFAINGAKKKSQLTIVVNHLKSKGSGCYEDWLNEQKDKNYQNIQGNCNDFRVSAAMVLADKLKTMSGDVLVMGDMNAYGMEDPIRVLTQYKPKQYQRKIMSASGTFIGDQSLHPEGIAASKGLGLVNLATKWHGADSYSYSYDGELGSLDHALASRSLLKKVRGIEDWHINSVENSLFEYSSKYSGDLVKSTGPYSASDHDPVIINFAYPMAKASFQITFVNNSNQPLYPVFNSYYWDSTKPWLMAGQQRRYTKKDKFLKHVGIKNGDKVSLSVLASGVYDVPCSDVPVELHGKLKAIYDGKTCRIEHF